MDCTRNRNRDNQISGSSKYEVGMDRRWSRLEFIDSLVFKSVGSRIESLIESRCGVTDSTDVRFKSHHPLVYS